MKITAWVLGFLFFFVVIMIFASGGQWKDLDDGAQGTAIVLFGATALVVGICIQTSVKARQAKAQFAKMSPDAQRRVHD